MKKIFLLDLDNTVIGKNYRPTTAVEELRVAIGRTVAAGHIVGVSSDSAIETIKAYMDQWSHTGPIIAEKGACAIAGESYGAEPAAILGDRSDVFDGAWKRIIDYSLAIGALVSCHDVNNLSRQLPGMEAPSSASRAVLVNSLRRASLSFYALEKSQGRWARSAGLMRKLCGEFLARSGKQECAFDVDMNDDYGICIIHHFGTMKAQAIPWVEAKYPGRQVIVVGDSMTDYHPKEGVVHCAVANASPEFKSKCAYTARGEVTSGVIEVLAAMS